MSGQTSPSFIDTLMDQHDPIFSIQNLESFMPILSQNEDKIKDNQQHSDNQSNITFIHNDSNNQNINIHKNQYDNMSKKELIERLIQLETKLLNTSDEFPTSQSKLDSFDEETRICLWDDCNKKFSTLKLLMTHLNEVHVGSGKPTYRCEWESCPRRDKPFMKRHKMYNHLRAHTGERPFVCTKPGCEKKFSRPDSLTTHIRTHTKIKPFVCSFNGCGKAYYYARSLKKHEKVHESMSTLSPAPFNTDTSRQPSCTIQEVGQTTAEQIHISSSKFDPSNLICPTPTIQFADFDPQHMITTENSFNPSIHQDLTANQFLLEQNIVYNHFLNS